MKRLTFSIVISVFLFVAGCVSSGSFPIESETRTDLSKNNYRVIKANVRGTDKGFWLLGIIPFASPSYSNAMESLHEKVDMEGRATALVNVSKDKSTLYLILFSVPKITVTADVIEFLEE
jgi:hypothetical protein